MQPSIRTHATRILGLAVALALLVACVAQAQPSAVTESTETTSNTETAAAQSETGAKTELRVGYQRGGELWNLLKAQGTLEKRFPDVTVTWSLFSAGPPLLEALNTGSVDIGAVGETPPIFAQAAGAPLAYVAQQAGSGAGSGIIVPENSPITTPEELRGKKIAFANGSSAHLLLIRALEKLGLQYGDIEPVLLNPPEARAAFEGGSVDAWVVWNPFLEGAIQELNARVLVDGVDVSPTKSYVIAASAFLEQHPEIITGIIEELRTAYEWSLEHQDEYAALLEQETEIPAAIWLGSFDRDTPELLYMDQETVDYQQKVADVFYNLELIPEKLTIQDVVWFGDQASQ